MSDTEPIFVIVLLVAQLLFKGDMNEDNLELLHVIGFENVTLLFEYFPLSEMVFMDVDPVIEEGDEDHDQLFSNKTQLLSALFMLEVCVTVILGSELDEMHMDLNL